MTLTIAPNPSGPDRAREIPEASVARLPVYHRALVAIAEAGITTVSSEELSSACGVTSAKLRKDLSYLGSYGTRGVGYDVEFLAYQISRELGLSRPWGVVVVGIGNLGRALTSYRGFASRGFQVVGLVDVHPDLIGKSVQIEGRSMEIRPIDDLTTLVKETAADIGVITTPAEAAQFVADCMVDAGLHSIVNFAPAVINVPDDVEVRKVDLALELQVLAFHEQRRTDPTGSVVSSLTGRKTPTLETPKVSNG